jgi:hypothetical protein
VREKCSLSGHPAPHHFPDVGQPSTTLLHPRWRGACVLGGMDAGRVGIEVMRPRWRSARPRCFIGSVLLLGNRPLFILLSRFCARTCYSRCSAPAVA